MSEGEQDAIDRFVGNRLVPNTQRIRLLLGILLLISAGTTASEALIASAMNGFLGAWFLGGWAALKRLIRHPRMQLRHYWNVLRNTPRVEIREYPDGSQHVAVMRPKLYNGWYWQEERGGRCD